MDNSDDSKGPRCPYRSDENDRLLATEHKHPLVAWKHFVDDQFSAITRLAFPRQTQVQTQDAARTQQEKDEAHRRWTGRDMTEDYDDMLVQRMAASDMASHHRAAKQLIAEASRRSLGVHPRRVQELYSDTVDVPHDPFGVPRLSFGGACYYKPESTDNLPSTDITEKSFGPAWLSVNWFKRSQYSPIHTEVLPGLEHSREAFEDLLDEALQRERLNTKDLVGYRPNYPQYAQSYTDGPGLDWMLSLYCRGILPPREDVKLAAVTSELTALPTGLPAFVVAQLSTGKEEYLDLVRAVACPPAWPSAAQPMETTQDSIRRELAFADETTFKSFTAGYRDYESDSPETDDLWRAVHKQDADDAASIIVHWEGQGRDVRDLIDADSVVNDYLLMDTDPQLWPLCEALEKAHSELLFEQSNILKAVERCPGMNGASVREDVVQPAMPALKVENPFAEEQPVGVLAQLTTTQVTRMPDGSVSTKTVLKKRFADGREETTESVKMEYPGHEQAKQDVRDEKKKGWFWS